MAEERKKILIVDDVKINRIILSNTLKDKYACVEADNGRDALEILKNDDSIRLMLLDISMPELDGFGVLTALRDNGKINSLPVIIISSDDDLQSQIKAFDAGADDIIGKPFNPVLVLHRVENLIKRQENAKFSEENRIYKENLNNLHEEITFYELDYKSGLYNQDAFLKKTHELLINNPNKEYVLVRWDIDRFKTYNELFGSEEGDKLLAAVGNFYHDKMVDESVVYGHFEADHFVYCVENKKFNIEQDFNDIQNLLNMYRPGYKFVPHLGAYVISDKSMDVRIMANRAYLALKSTKNKIVNAYAYYDLNMREQLIREQEIISNMNVALKAKQFQVYIQPQYDYSIQGISGGEALVRWLTSDGKIVPPNDFIPIFERNGFIEQLDKYVWEEVCKLIVKWRQNKILHTPISVNISRYDFYDPNLYDYIINLVERYKVKPEWLHLEITESAYMDNPGELLKIVNKLRAYGFLIEMDDFGSGYSSLNTLKNVPVDILKLDMKFLDKDESNDNKGGHILSSIVRMAHWINIPIIAEGVETKSQAEYLKSIGCYYMQGYYFSKPIPNEDFEKLLYTKDNLLLVTHKDEKPVTNAGDFFDASTEETLIFNSYVGGAIIVEYDRVNIEILRANDNFFNVLGIRREDFSGKSVDVTKRLNKENIDVYRKMLDDGIASGKETMCELCSELGHGENDKIYVRCRARFLYKKAKSYIFYIAVENISQRMELLDRNILLNKELNNVLGNLPGGIINFIYENKVARATYISPTLPAMIGYDYDDYLKSYSQNLLKTTDFNEKELKEVRKILSNAYKEKQFNFRFRVICKDKSIKHFEITGHILDVSESGAITITGLILSVEDKVKNEKVVQHQQNILEKQRLTLQNLYKTIPCGICEYSIRDNELILRSFNDSAWKIYGFKDAKEFTENIGAPINLIQIPDNELDQIKTSINSLLTINKSISFDHRVIRNDGVVAWLHTDLQRIRSFDGEPIIQSVFEDITESHNDEINRYTASLLNLYDEVMEFDIVKDTATLKKSKYVSSNLIDKPTSLKDKMSEYISKFVYEDDREKISRFLVESFSSNSNSNETKSVDYRLYNFKGGLSWCVLYLIKISDSVFLGCTKDTTMEKQAEETIKQNEILAASNREKKTREELMHIVLSEHGFVITTYDVNNDTLEYMTDSHGAETNGVVKDYLKNPTIPYIKSEHQKLVRDVFIEASKKESNGSFECLSKFDSATFRWKLVRYSSLLDESGKVYKVVSLISDIDEIKQNVSLVKSLSKSLGIKFESKTYNSVTDQLFQLLYDIKDTKVAINTVLAIVGKTLGASRSYLFEEDMDGIHCTNTFEWTNKGIPPVIQNNISFTHPISSNDYYTRFFNSDGMYVLNDIETLEPRFVENYRKQNVKALIQCVLKQDNKFIGYVGFDDDVRKRNWTNDQIHMVFLLSKTIGILLERKRQEEKSEVAIADFKALMNNSSALVYLINPDTYEILFENESVLKQKGNCVGKKCYKAFMDNDSPCYDCPYKALVKNGTSIPVEIVDISGKKFIMQASRTCFRDMDAINITGTDISVFDSKSSIDFEKARQADLNKYMNTLFTIYDEIFEINSKTRTAEVVRSRFNDKACGKTQPCGEAFDKWFKLMATPRDLEITKKFFNCNMIMEGYKSSSVPPQTEYDIRLPNGEIHNISTIIYKVDNVNFLLCTKDITKLKQAEALRINNDLLLLQREDQEKYRIIVEQLGATVIEYNFITNKFYASEGYKKYATSQQDQSKMLNNQGDMSVIYPDDIPLLEKFFKESSSRKGHSEVILRLKMVDGTFRWTKMESTYVRDKSNKPVRVIGTFTDVNDEMTSLYNYQETSLRLENIVSNIPCGIVIFPRKHKETPIFINDKAYQLLSFNRKNISEKDLMDLLIRDDKTFTPEEMEILEKGETLDLKYSTFNKKKEIVWLNAVCKIQKSLNGTDLCYATFTDITEQITKEQKENFQNERYRLLCETSNVVTFDYAPLTDTLSYSYVNEKGVLQDINVEHLLRDYPKTVDRIHPSSRTEYKEFFTKASIDLSGRTGVFEYRANYFNNGYAWYRAKYVSLLDKFNSVYRVVGRCDNVDSEVTEVRVLKAKAERDGLTKLINKETGLQIVETLMEKKPKQRVDALIMFDLDGFKNVNDTLGHLEGDRILGLVGVNIRKLFHGNDLVCRFGGDEFLVYISSIEEDDIAIEKAQYILETLYEIKDCTGNPTSASIGIVTFSDTSDYLKVIDQADDNLYSSKHKGKGRYTLTKFKK